MKISLLYTSARHHLILDVLTVWRDRSAAWEDVEVILVTDSEFDGEFPNMQHYLNTGRHDCVTGWNLAASKSTGDMLVQMQDDLFPPEQWDAQLKSFVRGVDTYSLHLADERGFPQSVFHPVISRSVYEHFGYLYPPDFRSMACDTWLYYAHRQAGFLGPVPVNPFWNHVHRTTHDVTPDEVTFRHESEERYRHGRQVLAVELAKLGIRLKGLPVPNE